MNRPANASAKSRELQALAQADTVAAHLLVPKRTNERRNNKFANN